MSSRCFVNKLSETVPSKFDTRLFVEESKKRLEQFADQFVEDVHNLSLSQKWLSSSGLYTGAGGIAYALHKAADRVQSSTKAAGEIHQLADKLMKANLQIDKLTEELANVLTSSAEESSDVADHDELFKGRAGSLAVVYFLRVKYSIELLSKEYVRKLLKNMVESGRKQAKDHPSSHSLPPLLYSYHGKVYLGAAHGLSYILLMLLCFFDELKQIDGKAERDVRKTVDWLVDIQLENGSVTSSLDSKGRPKEKEEDDQLIHWCHGAGGVVYLYAAAFSLWKDSKYLSACEKCCKLIWCHGLLRKGGGLCHGVSGNGYAFILMYQLTKEVRYLWYARQFADFMLTDEFRKGSRKPDSPESLYEGRAGQLYFYADLINFNTASFPFMMMPQSELQKLFKTKRDTPEQMRYFNNEYDETKVVGDWPKNVLVEKAICLAEDLVKRFQLTHKNCDGGIYVGLGGLAYALWYVSSKPAFQPYRSQLLEAAQTLIKYHLEYAEKTVHRDKSNPFSFLLGNVGLNLTAALIHQAHGEEGASHSYLNRIKDVSGQVLPLGVLPQGSDELFVGRAGYLCAVYNARCKLKEDVISNETVTDIVRSMIKCGRGEASKAPRGSVSPPLMYSYYNTQYFGAAHGLSAILQFIISFPTSMRSVDKKSEADVRGSVDFLLNLRTCRGNYPTAMDEIGDSRRREKDELIHWCHGAPGIIYLMGKAYLLWKNKEYLDACIEAGELIWERGLLTKGPGICHGVAGNAYAFLLLYKLTKDQKYVNRALNFAHFMDTSLFKSKARTPDCPYSLYEGLAGTLCFYADLIDPPTAEFPLFPL